MYNSRSKEYEKSKTPGAKKSGYQKRNNSKSSKGQTRVENQQFLGKIKAIKKSKKLSVLLLCYDTNPKNKKN
jgi:hypothetical protein